MIESGENILTMFKSLKSINFVLRLCNSQFRGLRTHKVFKLATFCMRLSKYRSLCSWRLSFVHVCHICCFINYSVIYKAESCCVLIIFFFVLKTVRWPIIVHIYLIELFWTTALLATIPFLLSFIRRDTSMSF